MGGYEILYLISTIQTAGISLLLLFYNSQKKKINRYLGFFFLFLFVQLIIPYLINFFKHPAVVFFPLCLFLLDITMLFFYTAETAGISIKQKYLYYIPAGIEFLIKSIVFVIVLLYPNYADIINKSPFYLIYYPIFNSVYIIFICFFIIKIVNKHSVLLPGFYKNIRYKRLTWLSVFCVVCIIYNLLWHLQSFMYPNSYFLYYFTNGIFLLTLYYITIVSLVQINILNITDSGKIKKIEENSFSKEELEALFYSIEKLMKEDKVFCNSSISLKMIAKTLKVNQRMVSKAINTIGNKNFKYYINNYRVEEFKKLITSDIYKKYSIESIAYEVGFNSRTSFYKNFKEITGLCPTEYIKDL